MGSIDIKSDQKVANNESESMVESPTTSDEDDLLELISSEHTSDSDDNELIVHSPPLSLEKASSSSSTSSSDFTLEDPFQESDYSRGETTNKGIDYTTESPPIQTMERLSPPQQKNRIPSSAYARIESNNIDGWGMPSNESLFSIKMTSFRNHDSINWRSDELDLGFGIEPSPSNIPMIPELDETCDSDEGDKDDEFVEELTRHHKLGEEDKIQSLSEIGNNLNLQDDQEDQQGKAVVEELNSHFSAENVGSTSSFAFPVLTADANKGSSPTVTGSTIETSEPQLETLTHTEPQTEPDKPTEPPKPNPPATTWTNCFGCCTFCS